MRRSAIARIIVISILGIGLLIPLAWVYVLVSERASRRDEAAAEIGRIWGGAQQITGPVLSVPLTTTRTTKSGELERVTFRAVFLARDLQIDGTLRPERRARGIFNVVVYHAQLKVSGKFAAPDVAALAAESVDWSNATINVGVSDPHGLTQRTTVSVNGREIPMTSGVSNVGLFTTGLHADVPLTDRSSGDIPFSLALELNGTRDLHFVPNAQETVVSLNAPWPHPSFDGRALPDTRDVGSDGFVAHWRVQDFARPFPGRWTTPGVDPEQLARQASESAFGLALMQPVDIYQQTERAVKYAVLFIALTFLVFFLWEVLHARLLHPVQYTFVGFALCVFYLLLVSLSEHVGFDLAYSLSAGVTTVLIAGYAWSVLEGRKAGASVLAALSALYGFLYLLLRLEDYALLAGSVALFLILAFVMYVTRRMDWYELKVREGEPRTET